MISTSPADHRGPEASNLKLQFDIYHRQMIHHEVMSGLETLLPITGHFQIPRFPADTNHHRRGRRCWRAACPGKTRLFRIIGCEYNPRAGTLEGLSWMKQLA